MNYTVDNKGGQTEYPFTCLAVFQMLIEYKRLEAEVIRNLSERKENEAVHRNKRSEGNADEPRRLQRVARLAGAGKRKPR